MEEALHNPFTQIQNMENVAEENRKTGGYVQNINKKIRNKTASGVAV